MDEKAIDLDIAIKEYTNNITQPPNNIEYKEHKFDKWPLTKEYILNIMS